MWSPNHLSRPGRHDAEITVRLFSVLLMQICNRSRKRINTVLCRRLLDITKGPKYMHVRLGYVMRCWKKVCKSRTLWQVQQPPTATEQVELMRLEKPDVGHSASTTFSYPHQSGVKVPLCTYLTTKYHVNYIPSHKLWAKWHRPNVCISISALSYKSTFLKKIYDIVSIW